MIRDIRLAATTAADGSATTTSAETIRGRVIAVEADVSGLDATADSTISVVSTPGGVDLTLLTLTNINTDVWHQLRALGSTNAGASTSEYVHPFVVGTPKVVIAQGGNAKSAVYTLYVDEDMD